MQSEVWFGTHWLQVLDCFALLDAIEWDVQCSGQQRWALLRRRNALWNEDKWMDCIEQERLGCLWFLIQSRVPCDSWMGLVYTAIESQKLLMLQCLLHPDLIFYNSQGGVHPKPLFPLISRRVHNTSLEVLQYLLWVYHSRYRVLGASPSLQQSPPLWMQVNQWFQDILVDRNLTRLRLCVPQFVAITSLDPFLFCIELLSQSLDAVTETDMDAGTGTFTESATKAVTKATTTTITTHTYEMEQLALYLWSHTPQSLKANVKPGVWEKVAIYNLHRLAPHMLPCMILIPHKALVEAFVRGHVALYQRMIQKEAHFIPPQRVLLRACCEATENVIACVPASVDIPEVCLFRALRESPCLELIETLCERLPAYHFTNQDIRDLTHSGRESVLLLIYQRAHSQKQELWNNKTKVLLPSLVEHSMYQFLRVLHQAGHAVYTFETLVGAATALCLPLLEDVLRLQADPFTEEEFQQVWIAAVGSFHHVNVRPQVMQLLSRYKPESLRLLEQSTNVISPRLAPLTSPQQLLAPHQSSPYQSLLVQAQYLHRCWSQSRKRKQIDPS
jgi:hypothetical protein